MQLVKERISEKLYNLFLAWQEEYDNNYAHDVNDVEAWNALIEYLIELESKQ